MRSLAAIHVARKQLDLDEDTYRGVLARVTGKSSAGDMSEGERGRVLDELRRLGFEAPGKGARRGLEGPYAKKLQALWIAAWNLGLVRDRTDKALVAFVRRQTGIEAAQWLRDAGDAKKVIEALKAWLAREGGVGWGWSHGYDFHSHDPGKVAWAQWKKLTPGATLTDRRGFDAAAHEIVGGSYPGKPLGDLKPADWRAVMNAFGERIRGEGSVR